MKKGIKLVDKGIIDYKEAWDCQKEYFNELQKECGENVLLLCEHPHVYTLGRNGYKENVLVSDAFLKSIDAKYYEVDRGGDITYHGFGQIVGYPIINLTDFSLTLKGYIHILEQAVINTVQKYGVDCGRIEGAAGVWCSVAGVDKKICAIGVKASRFITMHGFALNVSTNLDYFNYINPCGFTQKGVTSLAEMTGEDVVLEKVKETFCEEFSLLIGVDIKK